MKKSTQLRIWAIIILVVLSVIDALSIFVPIVAIGLIIVLLFRPKFLLSFIQKVYE